MNYRASLTLFTQWAWSPGCPVRVWLRSCTQRENKSADSPTTDVRSSFKCRDIDQIGCLEYCIEPKWCGRLWAKANAVTLPHYGGRTLFVNPQRGCGLQDYREGVGLGANVELQLAASHSWAGTQSSSSTHRYQNTKMAGCTICSVPSPPSVANNKIRLVQAIYGIRNTATFTPTL